MFYNNSVLRSVCINDIIVYLHIFKINWNDLIIYLMSEKISLVFFSIRILLCGIAWNSVEWCRIALKCAKLKGNLNALLLETQICIPNISTFLQLSLKDNTYFKASATALSQLHIIFWQISWSSLHVIWGENFWFE